MIHARFQNNTHDLWASSLLKQCVSSFVFHEALIREIEHPTFFSADIAGIGERWPYALLPPRVVKVFFYGHLNRQLHGSKSQTDLRNHLYWPLKAA